ncbi:MAG: hypothetical protein WCS59_00670 [Sphaerochaetaceae bacterium]|jgi:hypothetical protein|nr:hypothetical protein [Sphaerochaetaceae bacterium]MDD3367247.1 hypothetical protein [Sphaerochaetaceae bacterium]MDD4219689.1 hypothetical protein [Sphaerochaetaceae bacterium]MDY0371984.1 hypothetical protein [Sphaerochaetaceae bacterium]
MEHVVYLDAKEKELDKLKSGEKSMIIRGAAGRKLPHGRVYPAEVLWFIENMGDGMVRGRAVVKTVYNSEKLTEQESLRIISDYQPKLCLSPNQVARWGGKRFLVLIEIEKFQEVTPFAIDRSSFGNMDDWLPVDDIENIKKPLH